MNQTQSKTQTLEQQRAAHAWQCAQEARHLPGYGVLAKSLPPLIMNSGLLQVLAYLEEKRKSSVGQHYEKLAAHLRAWLHRRFGVDEGFSACMVELMASDPAKFREITIEALAWLRWVRQIAPALGTTRQG